MFKNDATVFNNALIQEKKKNTFGHWFFFTTIQIIKKKQ